MEQVRNFKPAWHAGMVPGLAYGGATLIATRGKEPWTFTWSKKDSEYTKPAAKCKKIEYPKADGKYTFDILDNLIRSNVNHEHDQPAHLRVKEEKSEVPLEVSLKDYDGPEGRFCPAKVYEWCLDTLEFENLHDEFKRVVEQAETDKIDSTLMKNALAQLAQVENLLVEKKQVEEEVKLKQSKK